MPGSRYEAYDLLKLELDDGVMTIAISNPGKKNACTPEMGGQLGAIWHDLADDPDVDLVVVTGDGADFCAGVDLSAKKQQQAHKDERKKPLHRTTRSARHHVMNVLDFEKPTIAKVRGAAYGMGVNLALACDFVFASPDAVFCDSHVKAGMVAGDGGVLLWPLAIGMRRAKHYLMTGKKIPAELAEKIGLITACVPGEGLDDTVAELIDELRRLPPHAVNYTKMSLNVLLKQMAVGAFEMSLAYEIYTMGMGDFNEATDAFLEKRQGKFRGQ